MSVESDVCLAYRSERQAQPVDAAVAARAAAQHGVITREQLGQLGLSGAAIDRRLRAGRLHRVHRGVYAVGHPRLTRSGIWLAAVLSAGPGAVLSHRPAGALWRMRPSDRLEVTVASQRRQRGGIVFHESPVPSDEREEVDGIPTTTPHRTLLDLAAILAPDHLRRALNEAERLRLTDPLPLSALIARHPHRRGVAALRAALDERAQMGAMTNSELEQRFLRLVRRTTLPRPRTNVHILGFECDVVWPDHGLIVELDGRSTHDTARAFERDRSRDRKLQAAGWRVIRVTWRQLHRDGAALLADLRRALGRGGGRPWQPPRPERRAA